MVGHVGSFASRNGIVHVQRVAGDEDGRKGLDDSSMPIINFPH